MTSTICIYGAVLILKDNFLKVGFLNPTSHEDAYKKCSRIVKYLKDEGFIDGSKKIFIKSFSPDFS